MAWAGFTPASPRAGANGEKAPRQRGISRQRGEMSRQRGECKLQTQLQSATVSYSQLQSAT
eukprot:2602423-Prymnesium_polylepis.2